MIPRSRSLGRSTISPPWSCRYLSTATSRLRILFCGSDDFSVASLNALQPLKDQIESIDVVCRPPKRHGRRGKLTAQPPIFDAARMFGLSTHQIDTFKGWTPPNPFDLIVAVSFGLLVPRRLLLQARYGGINIHPSLLPDLRGPAPIQWALLHGLTHSGVTLQTLHPTKMDHGRIIDQTHPPGVRLPTATEPRALQRATQTLADAGAEMLARNIVSGLSVEPSAQDAYSSAGDETSRWAPKIESKHLQLRPEWAALDIVRRCCVLGPLWDQDFLAACDVLTNASIPAPPRRIKYDEWVDVTDMVTELRNMNSEMWQSRFVLPATQHSTSGPDMDTTLVGRREEPMLTSNRVEQTSHNSWRGRRVITQLHSETHSILFQSADGRWMSPKRTQVEGHTWKPAAGLIGEVARRYGSR